MDEKWFRKLYKQSGLIPGYRDVEWDAGRGDPAAHRAVEQYINEMGPEIYQGLWLAGPPGTGKTLLAHKVAIAAVRFGARVRFITIQSYMDLLQRQMSVGHHDMQEQEWADESRFLYFEILTIKGEGEPAHVVVIDDLGKEHTTTSGWAEREINALIRHRYNRGLVTVVTTNANRDQMEELYGEHFSSFMQQAFRFVPVNGIDHRRVSARR